MIEAEINARHKKRMERLKVTWDKIQARKTKERGLLHDFCQAARVADNVLLLQQRRVVTFGPVEQVLQPAILRDVYGVEVHIGRALGGEPVLVPLRRSVAAG